MNLAPRPEPPKRRKALPLLPVLAVAGVISAFAGPTSAAPPADGAAVPSAQPSYRLESGDVVQVEVLSKPELTRTIVIPPDGIVAFPYCGKVKAAGASLTELSDLIATRLSRELGNPQVTATLARRRDRRVTALGLVRTPGKHALEDGWRVLDLIAECGGVAERADWLSATLVRGGQTIPVDVADVLASGSPEKNLALEPGDVLLVREKEASTTRVQVLGAVGRPGWVPAPRDGSLTEVVLAAGGFSPRAALAEATVTRDGKTTPIDLSTFGADGKEPEGVRLQPGDVLTIPLNKLSFMVVGSVTNPGAQVYPAKEKMTVLNALMRAGGAAQGADLKNAALVRTAANGERTIRQVDLDTLLRKKGAVKESDVALEPNDVLYVPAKKPGGNGFNFRDALGLLPFVGWLAR